MSHDSLQPQTMSHDPLQPQTMFMNEEYIVPQPLPVDDITRSVNQSDCDVGSHDTPDGPLEKDQKSTFADITMATKYIVIV